jgi:hypothetical protein
VVRSEQGLDSCIRHTGAVPLLGGPAVAFALPPYLFVKALIWVYKTMLVPCVLAIWAYSCGKVFFTLGGWLLPDFNKSNREQDPDKVYSYIRQTGAVPLLGGPAVAFALPPYLFVKALILVYEFVCKSVQVCCANTKVHPASPL